MTKQLETTNNDRHEHMTDRDRRDLTKLLQTLKQRPEPEVHKANANERNEQTYYNAI